MYALFLMEEYLEGDQSEQRKWPKVLETVKLIRGEVKSFSKEENAIKEGSWRD